VTDRLVPAVGGRDEVPAPDEVARDYLLLALRLDQHVPGLVDAYYGPRDLKALVDMENLVLPARLAEDARALRRRVPAEVGQPDRRDWLDRQLIALETHASRLAGHDLSYVDEVARFLDAPPRRLPPDAAAAARAALAGLLPGTGGMAARLVAWEDRFVVPPALVRPLVDLLLPAVRDASMARFAAPDGESLRVGLVTGQPWSGYNWYDGGLRSRVDLNVDLPIRPVALIDVLTHETYPGHHLEHTWKEQRLVRELGRLEASVQLINTPECYVSEGLADLGGSFTLDPATRAGLLQDACRAAGLPASDDDVAAQLAVRSSLRELRGLDGDAALMLHAEGRPRDEVAAFLREEALLPPDRAEKRLEFITHPLWRTYVFNYAGGESLLRAWCARGDAERAVDPALAGSAGTAAGAPHAGPTGSAAAARFMRLLTEQLTPFAIAAELDRPAG
jgi:hypothetical protein